MPTFQPFFPPTLHFALLVPWDWVVLATMTFLQYAYPFVFAELSLPLPYWYVKCIAQFDYAITMADLLLYSVRQLRSSTDGHLFLLSLSGFLSFFDLFVERSHLFRPSPYRLSFFFVE